MFRKRAQGISITTVVVAVIALIVIVVIVSILTGRVGQFSAGLESIGDPTKKCQGSVGNGGTLRTTCLSNENSIVSSDAIAEGKKCCKGTGSTAPPATCAKVNEDCITVRCCSGLVCNDEDRVCDTIS